MPGDLYAIEEGQLIPCDTILLSGEVLLNEASLTGESNPVPKIPLDNFTNINFSY